MIPKLTLDLNYKDSVLVMSNRKNHYASIELKNPKIVKSIHPLIKKIWPLLQIGGVLKGNGYSSNNLAFVKSINHFCGVDFWLATSGEDWEIKKTKEIPYRTKILRLPYTEDHLGGLGDLLLYNHIPRLAKDIGGVDKVIIETKFRNPDFKKIVYDNNPYINEVRDPDVNELRFLTSVNWIEKKIETSQFFPNPSPGRNYYDLVVDYFDLSDGKILRTPDFYYKPKFLPHYQNSIIWDPNFTSGNTVPSNEFVAKELANKKFDYQIKSLTHRHGPELNLPVISTKNIEELIDILYSCKEFWGYDTGHNHVAYALNKRINVFTRQQPYNTEIQDISTYLWHYPYFHVYHVEKL